MGFFSLASYQPDVFSVAILLVGLAIALSGLLVWSRDWREPTHAQYGVMAIVFALSIVPTGISLSTMDPGLSKLWDRLGWVPTCLIPAVVFSFVGSHLEIAGRRRWVPWYYLASALLIPFVFTDLFVDHRHVFTYPWGEVARMGWAGYVYMVFFYVTIGMAVRAHWRRLHAPYLSERKRKMYAVTFTAMCFGALAGLDFLGYVGIPWPPFSFVFLALWMTLYAYAILKFKLFHLTNTAVAPALLESMPGAIFVANTDGEIMFVNPYASRMTLVPEQETRGRAIGEFLPAASEALDAVAGLHPVGPILWEREMTLMDAGGKPHPVSVSATAIRSEGGETQGYTFIATDIEKLLVQMEVIDRQKAELEKTLQDMRDAQEQLVQREIRMIRIKKEIDRLKTAA